MKKAKMALIFGGIVFLGIAAMWKFIEKTGRVIESKNKLIDKYKLYYHLNNKWISLKESDRRLGRYFTDNKISSIAVYGMGDIGLNLCDELIKDGIAVKYALDRDLARYDSAIPIKKMEDALETVDAVVITVPDEFEAIRKSLEGKFSCPIISIDEIIYSV